MSCSLLRHGGGIPNTMAVQPGKSCTESGTCVFNYRESPNYKSKSGTRAICTQSRCQAYTRGELIDCASCLGFDTLLADFGITNNLIKPVSIGRAAMRRHLRYRPRDCRGGVYRRRTVQAIISVSRSQRTCKRKQINSRFLTAIQPLEPLQ